MDVGLWDDAAGLAREATETFDGLGDDSAAGSAAATWGTALGQAGDITAGRAVVLPRWERLRDDPSATRAALALSRALVYTCHTGQVDEVARESLAVRARLAEKVDDPGELADTFLWTGIDHLFTGATTLGLTLIDATARIARENQLTQPLTRALINLTANAITEDAGEAVVSGREAVLASRRGGTASQRSTAQLNLALALWVRGSWSEMATLVGSVRPGIGAVPFEEYVFIGADYLLARATGRATVREDRGIGDRPDLYAADRSWVHWANALRLSREGRPDAALPEAVLAVDGYGTVYDDQLHFWATALELAQEVGDRTVEERLFADVDSVNAVVPRGLRAHRVRFAAAALRRDAGTDALGRTPQDAAPEVERLLREAVDLYTSWGALAYEARARGELGVWLARQGRTDEADPFLDASRTRLREVGAETWLGDLELSLVTAR